MLKRKLVMTVLPLLTTGILVGSGFSAWTFGGRTGSVDQSLAINITDKVIQSVTIEEKVLPTQITLDQGISNLLTSGITFNEDYYTLNVTADTGVTNVSVTLEITINNTNLSNYVEFNDRIGTNLKTINSIFTGASFDTDDHVTAKTLTLTGSYTVNGGATKEIAIALNDNSNHNYFFDYKDNKPDTSTDYNQMKEDLQNEGSYLSKVATFKLSVVGQ